MDENKIIQSILVGLITLVLGTFLEKGVEYHFKTTCAKGKDISKKPVREISLILLGIIMNLLPEGIHFIKKSIKML